MISNMLFSKKKSRITLEYVITQKLYLPTINELCALLFVMTLLSSVHAKYTFDTISKYKTTDIKAQ